MVGAIAVKFADFVCGQRTVFGPKEPVPHDIPTTAPRIVQVKVYIDQTFSPASKSLKRKNLGNLRLYDPSWFCVTASACTSTK